MSISISLQPPPPLERNALLRQGKNPKQRKERAALRLVLLSAFNFASSAHAFTAVCPLHRFMTAQCRMSRSVAVCYSIIASRKDKGI